MGGTDVPDESAPALALEPHDTDGPATGAAHAVAQLPCSFIVLEVTADTTIIGCDQIHCQFNTPKDTIITVDTTVHRIDDYRGTVYVHPRHVYPGRPHIQVVDMQPDSTRHRKELDLIRWRCDEGYDPELVLTILPNQPQWVEDGLHLETDPWGYSEPVVALAGDVPHTVAAGEWERSAILKLVEGEDGEVVTRGKAGLLLRALERPTWFDGENPF